MIQTITKCAKSKQELIKQCRELEKRGFDYVAPIAKIKRHRKLWKNPDGKYHRYRRDFMGVSEGEFYFVKMRREV
jgi:hypothetical protein